MDCIHLLDPLTCSFCKPAPTQLSFWGRFDPAWLAGFPVESRVTVPIQLTPYRDTVGVPSYRPRQLEGKRPHRAPVASDPAPSFWDRWASHPDRVLVYFRSEAPEAVRSRDLEDGSMWTDEQRKAIDLAVRAGLPWDTAVLEVMGEDESDNDPWHPMPAPSAPTTVRPLEVGSISSWRERSGRRGGFAPPRSTLVLVN